jgi:hypothetical protein
MLYSLGAMTTYGHADLKLGVGWQLMGPLEALDGVILFGLTTAFLLAIIQNAWHASNRSTCGAEQLSEVEKKTAAKAVAAASD